MAALYADDTKIYRSIKSIGDCIKLQTTIDNFDEWSQRNNIQFNASKCKVLTVTRTKNPIVYNYHLNQVQLERVNSEKDIGVVVSSTLSWDLHAQNIVKKANRILGLLKRTCPLLTDVSVRRSLYLAHVKSQLSYATQVWSPSMISLKSEIENVQRRATRWILRTRVGEMSYKDRLLTLNLLPLSFDRELKDLVFFYKCFNNLTDLNVRNFISFVCHGRTRLSSSYSL